MRRNIALSLFLTMLLSVILTPLTESQVYAADNTKQIINAIGIMETDKGSNADGTKKVTRARFAQMLVNASTLKDSVSSKSNVTLFSDVKKNYWASGYIQTAVSQDWMSGYLNGSFKPTKNITLQQAVYGVIKLLGYTNSDFTGSISDGMMKLYKTKSLNKNISKTASQYITVNDCYQLFYNTLKATTKAGTVYAVSLGYKVDSSGELNYLSLVSSEMVGPIVADDSWKTKLPFSTAAATFYKDGVKCSIADISDYDVLYYSESLQTVWVYDNKVTGTIEAVSPDYSAPTSITVSSKSYSFGSSDAALKFSTMGDVKVGEKVTLILDKSGAIVDVLNIDEYNTTITGVVTEIGTHISEQNGTYVTTGYFVFVDAGGNKYEQDYNTTSIYFEEKDIARVTYTNGVATVSKITQGSSLTGNTTFNSDGSMLGTTALASNVKILDMEDSQYISIYPERLSGVTLSSSSIYYYELNKYGEISQLILCNVTGDIDQYGIYTGLSYQSSLSKNIYSYLIGSTSSSLTLSSASDLCTEIGPVGLVFTDGELTASYALKEEKITAIGSTTVQTQTMKIPFADSYTVYYRLNGQYTATTLEKVSDLTKYNLYAYYDDTVSGGGRVRVIVAGVK